MAQDGLTRRTPTMRSVALAVSAVTLLLCLAAEAKVPKPPPPSPKPPSPAPSPPPLYRKNNGVRLVGGSGSKGRLEIASKDSWVVGSGSNATVGWRPVCDNYGYGFSDNDALIMCKLLGYSYGRRHYSPRVTYRPPYSSGTRTNPVGFLQCTARASAGHHHRRLLEGNPDIGSGSGTNIAADGAAVITDSTEGAVGSNLVGRSRSLQALERGTVNTPKAAPYKCTFMSGLCDYTGALAGVECSHTPMPPAPSPPPSPPPPPSVYAIKDQFIRMYGGTFSEERPVEPNLCPDYENSCDGRFEIQVTSPSGEKVWAPLCLGRGTGFGLSTLACKQAMNWVDRQPRTTVVNGVPSSSPYHVPTEPVTTAGYFNPASYKYWATVVGGDPDTAQMVQDLNVTVSATPCSTGVMVTVECIIAMF